MRRIVREVLVFIASSGSPDSSEFTWCLKQGDVSPSQWKRAMDAGDGWRFSNPERGVLDYVVSRSFMGHVMHSLMVETAAVVASQWSVDEIRSAFYHVDNEMHEHIWREEHCGPADDPWMLRYSPMIDLYRTRSVVLLGAIAILEASDVLDVMTS